MLNKEMTTHSFQQKLLFPLIQTSFSLPTPSVAHKMQQPLLHVMAGVDSRL
jgi:hypothetical protein